MTSSASPVVNRIRIIPRTDDFLDRNVGSSGEIFFNKNTGSLRLYDGNTQGGSELARADLTNVNTAIFANADLSNVDLTSYATVESLSAFAQADLSNVTDEEFLLKAESSGFTGGASVDIGINPPTEPEQGNIWFNSNNGKLYVYVTDDNSSQWVQPSIPIPSLFSSVAVSDSSIITASGIDSLTLLEGSGIQIIADPETNTITFSAQTGFSGDYNDLTNKPTYSTVATSGSYTDLTDKPTSFDQLTVTASALNNALEVVNNDTSTIVASINSNGLLTLPSLIATDASYLSRTYEYAHNIDSASSSVTFNTDSTQTESVFYLTNITGNFVANFANVDVTGTKTISYAIILDQGATPYMISNLQVNGSNQQVKWQGGTGIPAGTANQINVLSVTILIFNDAVEQVIASLTSYA